MSEDGNHVFVSRRVEVVHLVTFVEDVSHHLRGWCVDDGRGDDVGHVAVVLVFGDAEFGIGVELAYACQMDVSAICILSVLASDIIDHSDSTHLNMVIRTDFSAASP